MEYVRFKGKFSTQRMVIDGVPFNRNGDAFEFPMFLYESVKGIGMIRRGLADGSITEERFEGGYNESIEVTNLGSVLDAMAEFKPEPLPPLPESAYPPDAAPLEPVDEDDYLNPAKPKKAKAGK